MLKISEMSGKLKHIPAINCNPLTNEFCKKMSLTDSVCKHCYSQKMLKTFRANCVKSFENNSKLLSENVIVEYDLPTINNVFFRFHAHGELINNVHFINLLGIVHKNPRTTFALWTKRKDIVNEILANWVKPKNLILIYSNPSVDTILKDVPKYFDKVFNVTADTFNNVINCGSKSCWNCGLCYTKNETSVIIEKIKLKKNGKS